MNEDPISLRVGFFCFAGDSEYSNRRKAIGTKPG